MAASLGQDVDPEECLQIKNNTYVDDGAGGGSRLKVDRYRGEFLDGEYNGTLPRIFKKVGLKLKVMIVSGDSDQEKLDILGDKVLGHIFIVRLFLPKPFQIQSNFKPYFCSTLIFQTHRSNKSIQRVESAIYHVCLSF